MAYQPAVIWLTGLSGSGKSTIAREVLKNLRQQQIPSTLLDADLIRKGLNRDLGFSPADRHENIRRVGEVARLFFDAGLVTICAFISPYRKDRDAIRSLLPTGRFIEVYVNCPLNECEKRDPKGLYRKARKQEIPEFTGISAPYEEPSAPELLLETEQESVEKSVDKLLKFLENHLIFP